MGHVTFLGLPGKEQTSITIEGDEGVITDLSPYNASIPQDIESHPDTYTRETNWVKTN